MVWRVLSLARLCISWEEIADTTADEHIFGWDKELQAALSLAL